jgi:hypothetical protein
MEYRKIVVAPGEAVMHTFPDHFQARWIRFKVDKPSTVTTWLDYN